ncbi:MAG: LysM peptidoglycan-binding domain-containing protein [Verrucomicrobiaceae bacterium]|nr:LysM peptidoglycan-binding domain-containing protein [Verrucomicrobiaceae bacterium]
MNTKYRPDFGLVYSQYGHGWHDRVFSRELTTPMITYSIRSGDTLSRVARQHGVRVRDILRHNPQITDPNRLFIGQVIQIPVNKPAAHPVNANWFAQHGPPCLSFLQG